MHFLKQHGIRAAVSLSLVRLYRKTLERIELLLRYVAEVISKSVTVKNVNESYIQFQVLLV